jgi:hypothetical protein
MKLNELCTLAYARAKAAGWWEPGKEKRPLEVHALIVSEVAEAMEAFRNRKPAFYLEGPITPELRAKHPEWDLDTLTVNCDTANTADIAAALATFPSGKPEGEATELADTVIRIADWFGRNGWDLEAVVKAKMDYNATRGIRHGNKAA